MFKKEGTYVYLCLIYTVVWQKPKQYCKAILQLKINLKKREREILEELPYWSTG